MTARRSSFSFLATPQASQTPEVDPGPHIFVAPELIGREYEVIRHEGDSDEAYALRCELFALVTKAAKTS